MASHFEHLVTSLRTLDASHPHYKSYGLEAARAIQDLERDLEAAKKRIKKLPEGDES